MHLSEPTLKELTQLIQKWSGLALGPDKAYLVRHRLAPVVRSCGFGGFDELLLRLKTGGATRIQDAVIEAITTKETSFFRDDWLFDALLQNVLPELLKSRQKGYKIRIWSAGTSTGQEAYSIAMIVRELIESTARGVDENDFAIVATDISGEAIDAAKTGLYSRAEVGRGLTEPRLRRFFVQHGDGWMINESLRRLVQFRTFNLLRPTNELGAFDLVLCRNVMIYFDEPTRAQTCRSICESIKAGGWLTVGSAESLYGTDAAMTSVKFARAFLYQKK